LEVQDQVEVVGLGVPPGGVADLLVDQDHHVAALLVHLLAGLGGQVLDLALQVANLLLQRLLLGRVGGGAGVLGLLLLEVLLLLPLPVFLFLLPLLVFEDFFVFLVVLGAGGGVDRGGARRGGGGGGGPGVRGGQPAAGVPPPPRGQRARHERDSPLHCS